MPRQENTRSGLKVALQLIGLVKPLAGYMVLAITLGVLGFLTAIFIPVLGAYALLEVAGYAVPLPFLGLIGALVACAVVRGFLRYGEQLCNHYIAFKLLALIRDKVFRALRRLAPAKLEGRDKGDLITVLTSDIELLEVFYAHTISPVAIAIITSGIMLAFMGAINWLFALIALVAYLVVGLAIPLITSQAGRALGLEYRTQSGALSSYLLDSLRGLKEVLQYGQGENRLGGIRSRTLELSEKQARLKRIEALAAAATTTAIMVFALVVLGMGVALYSAGAMTVPDVIIGFVAMISSFGPVVALSNLANNLVHTFAAGNRVLDILEEQPVTGEVTGRAPLAPFSGITCNKVDFAYEDEAILSDFNLKVRAGQTIGIAGKSGSGKSTLLRLMMRFWDVDRGSVLVGDTNVKDANTADLRNNQSFVTQDTQIFDDTIANNIRIGKLDATDDEVVEACKKASLHEFISTLPQGYDTPAGELGDALSGGERQRIGLARAFVHDAPLMLLDEPTSNLDSLNEGIILESLRDRTQGKTVILVSHRLSSMAFADEIVSMGSRRVS